MNTLSPEARALYEVLPDKAFGLWEVGALVPVELDAKFSQGWFHGAWAELRDGGFLGMDGEVGVGDGMYKKRYPRGKAPEMLAQTSEDDTH